MNPEEVEISKVTMPYELGELVRVVNHKTHPRYIGLRGKIVWKGRMCKCTLYQIETTRKPPYYRLTYPDRYIITVASSEIRRIKH